MRAADVADIAELAELAGRLERAGSFGSEAPSGLGAAIRCTSGALVDPSRVCGDTMPGDDARCVELLAGAAVEVEYRDDPVAEVAGVLTRGVLGGVFTRDVFGGVFTRDVLGGVLARDVLGGGALARGALGAGVFTRGALGGGALVRGALGGGVFARGVLGFAGPALGSAGGCDPRPKTPSGSGADPVKNVPECDRVRCCRDAADSLALGDVLEPPVFALDCCARDCDAPSSDAPGAGSEVCKDVFSSSQSWSLSLARADDSPRDSALSLFFG